MHAISIRPWTGMLCRNVVRRSSIREERHGADAGGEQSRAEGVVPRAGGLTGLKIRRVGRISRVHGVDCSRSI